MHGQHRLYGTKEVEPEVDKEIRMKRQPWQEVFRANGRLANSKHHGVN